MTMITNPPRVWSGPTTINTGINAELDPGSLSLTSASLTPDALMAYCATRLGGLDAQMQKQFEGEQQNYNDQQILDQVGALFADCAGGINTDDQGAGAMKGAKLLQGIQQKLDDPNLPPELRQELTRLRDSVANGIGGPALQQMMDTNPDATLNAWLNTPDKYKSDTDFLQANGCALPPQDGGSGPRTVSGTTVSQWQNQLKDMSSELNNSGQMGMIQLQSLMSDRQTAIQMCTNLVQALGDQANKIAANVGH